MHKTKDMNFLRTGIITLMMLSLLGAEAQDMNREELDASIEKYRKGTIFIEGEPGARVEVKQLKHEFWFGCAISSGIFSERSWNSESDKEMYKEKFLENFNSAVTENAVKWASMERRRGQIDYKTSDNILDWTEANGIPCRGHNLYWGIEQFVQDWVKDLDDEELLAALEKRGKETAAHFKGRFYEYDLNNEMIHGNYYADRLGRDITVKMADWVLEGDPDAKLWVNDYDILTGNRLGDYMDDIKSLQQAGVPVSGIGVQGHLHGDTFSRETLQGSLDALATLDLPIRITEFNMPGQRSKFYGNRDTEEVFTEQDEEQKAKDIVDYYRICFAQPAVEGILMWGFWEGANWIKVSSLYKQDWTPTPALEAYQDLIFKEWNTHETVTLDNQGKAAVPAFFGDYMITCGSEELRVTLSKEIKETHIEL